MTVSGMHARCLGVAVASILCAGYYARKNRAKFLEVVTESDRLSLLSEIFLVQVLVSFLMKEVLLVVRTHACVHACTRVCMGRLMW